MTAHPLLTVEIRQEQDVVLCRQRARQVAGLLGFTPPEQTSIATAVSEIARNALRYGGRGRAEFSLLPPEPPGDANPREAGPRDAAPRDARPMLLTRVTDQGPGIANLQQVLDGQHRTAPGGGGGGGGLGLIGSRWLSDRFEVDSAPGRGTAVLLGKRLSSRPPHDAARLAATVTAELARRPPQEDVLQEVVQQNRELLRAMKDLQARQDEVERLNAELAETNRGVLALYAELDEKAASLARASEYKSRFLSDMSHELRTPLNAMISLTGLLLDRADGDLTGEQEIQVRLIRKSALNLSEMVNDLLDLAKIEAGKVELRIAPFAAADLLTAVRGIFRPLVAADGPVRFQVDDPPDELPPLCGDEGKLAQILRNLVSNALKFTERGEVRVTTEHDPAADDGHGRRGMVWFRVTDTGIGIAPADQPRVFEDFTQVDSAIQRRVRGTGLGLPLSRKLARLLGGDVTVRSRPGEGSTFTVAIPVHCPAPPADALAVPDPAPAPQPAGETA